MKYKSVSTIAAILCPLATQYRRTEKRYYKKQQHTGGPDMKTKSICSAFFAVIAVFLTAATALPFATLAQEDGQLKPTVARPNSGYSQPAARTTEELLRQGFELREMVEAQIKTLEQNQDADEAWKAGQIEVQRQSLADLDRKIAVLKDRLAREKDAAGDVSAPGRETDNTKELSLPIRKIGRAHV